jgi:pimeloyl-ACP methyl ester carboxylesterase
MKDALFRWGARRLVPAWAKEMDDEGIFRLRAQQALAQIDEREYLVVEDVGADVTLFAFSGLDGLFGVAPRFEFRGLLSKLEYPCNLVFVRELRGFWYHLAPDGSPEGLAYFERRLSEVMAQLGARHNMAMGFSAGGSAAFYFGTRCGMQKILAFSPAFPVSVYTSAKAQLLHYLNLKKLVTDPAAYCEVAAVMNWGLLSEHRMAKVVEPERQWDVLATYRDCPKRPRATLVYGRGCRQDATQAGLLAGFPEVKPVAVAAGCHNVPGYLKQRGELASLVVQELRDMVASAQPAA